MSRFGWRPYVPVGVRRARALKKMEKLRKKGLDIKPVEIEGRKIARTFWGEAWSDHLESFSDYENRLPRGRTYVRNGSVCHLDIARGEINAMVSGSDLYTVKIAIKALPRKKWQEVKNRCAGKVGSLLELLQGELSKNVMSVVTHRSKGLFPLPGEIKLQCSCPDWAVMCKHVAAVLYGVGARLDEEPDLLFLLRGVNHEELVGAEVDVVAGTKKKGSRRRISDEALADVFDIEMSEEVEPAKKKPAARRKKSAPKSKKTSKVAAKQKPKRQASVAKSAAPPKKKPAPGKLPKKKKTSRPAPNPKFVAGKAVAELRAKFNMSRGEFAQLLGVSVPSIANWEKKTGRLNLKPRSLEAWNAAKKLTKRKAWQKLDG